MNKIAICLPSKNEEDTISFVTKIIDNALSIMDPDHNSLIINVDSSSTDKTVSVFNSTKTENKKISLINQTGGKGQNIYTFLKYIQSMNFDYLGMFDTDLTSIETSWIIKMTNELILGADFVSPSYQRSPFEGSTTNHLCRPIISALYGKNIQQPIAGDFMFSNRLGTKVLSVLEHNVCNDYFYYGIDILITLTAVLFDFNTAEVVLSKKIHKPSFPKIEKMFIEVATALFSTINMKQVKFFPPTMRNKELLEGVTYSHKVEGDILLERNLKEYFLREKDYRKLFDSALFSHIEEQISTKQLTSETWAAILAAVILKTLKYPPAYLAECLKPLFIIRAVTFWKEAERRSVCDMEKQLFIQTNSLIQNLRRNHVY